MLSIWKEKAGNPPERCTLYTVNYFSGVIGNTVLCTYGVQYIEKIPWKR